MLVVQACCPSKCICMYYSKNDSTLYQKKFLDLKLNFNLCTCTVIKIRVKH